MNTFCFCFVFLLSSCSNFFLFLLPFFPLPFYFSLFFPLSFLSFSPPCFLAFSIFFYQERRQCRLVILRQFPAHEYLGRKSQIFQSSRLRKRPELAPAFLLILRFHTFPILFFLPVFSFLVESSILSHIYNLTIF